MSSRKQLHDDFALVTREFIASAVFFQEAVARAAGINSTDLQALGILVASGPVTPGELARRTGITAGGAITLLVDRLEAAGFAHRRRDQHDRRRVQVSADADQVAERVATLYVGVAHQWGDYLATLTTQELTVGLDILRTAVAINQQQVEHLARREEEGSR